MKRFPAAFLLAFALSSFVLQAQESDTAFRASMRRLVSEGNRQSDRSNRAGIKAVADSIASRLEARSQAGLLQRNDSLEFTADWYKLLGDWHYENSNIDTASYKKAEHLFLQAGHLYSAYAHIFGEDLDKGPMICRGLAQLYYKEGRYADALGQVEAALDAFEEAYGNGLFEEGDPLFVDWTDLRMQKALCLARLGKDGEAERMAERLLKDFPKGSERYYESLRKKAKIIMLSDRIGREKQALPLYRTYFDWQKKDALASLKTMTPAERQDYWMRMRPFVTDCFQLEGEDPGFLFDVAMFSKGLLLQFNAFDRNPETIKQLDYGWQDVQKRLPADGCAIEFLQYEKDERQRMGAVLLGKTGQPVWISLPSPDVILESQAGGKSIGSRISSTAGKVKNALYENERLREIIWTGELQQAIGENKDVYFSPDGYLHQLAIEYLLPEALEGKRFYRLSSTRQIILKRQPRLDAALIVGGITYLTDQRDNVPGNDSLAFRYLNGVHARFNYLPGTKFEAEAVRDIRNTPADSLLTGLTATEPALRSLMGQYSILCLSTHGFFRADSVPTGTDLKTCLTDESLSQSVLALAGVGKSIGNPLFDPSRQDGILSSAEIAELDLSKVDLAIISACQSGLGQVSADGVYGIQRGLKDAGTGALVVSLWNVDDKSTILLMKRFHEGLVQGKSVHEAFMDARASLMNPSEGNGVKTRRFNPRTMRNEYIEEEAFNRPQYYNAFILIDAI